MQQKYNIFECLLDGSIKWHSDVYGLIKARRTIRELVSETGGEFFGIELPERKIIFHSEGPALDRRVFQIAYAKDLGQRRAHVLRPLGFGVWSVIGNSAAERLLDTLKPRP